MLGQVLLAEGECDLTYSLYMLHKHGFKIS